MQNGYIVNVSNYIETPTPLVLSDGQELQNPACYSYEQFTVAGMLDYVSWLINDRTKDAAPFQYFEIVFDDDYGFVKSLSFAIEGGEAAYHIIYSDFRIEKIE